MSFYRLISATSLAFFYLRNKDLKMNNNNFSDNERLTVQIVSIKNPVYIKVVEIGGLAFEELKKIFKIPI